MIRRYWVSATSTTYGRLERSSVPWNFLPPTASSIRLQVGHNKYSRSRGFSSSLQVDDCDDTHLSTSKDCVPRASVMDNGAQVAIVFDTMEHSTFHAPWLWSNDPTWVHPTSGQRLRTPGGYPSGTCIKSVTIVSAAQEKTPNKGVAVLPLPPPPKGSSHPIGNVYVSKGEQSKRDDALCLRVTWESPKHSSRPVSYYDLDWLQQWRYDNEALDARRARTRVTPLQTLQGDGRIPTFDYSVVEHDTGEFTFQFLDAIVRYGAGLIQNAPIDFANQSTSPVETIGLLLGGGSLSHGALYGNTFHVEAVQDASNIAYTPTPLGPHSDLAYYESKPGLQLLHCLSNKGVTGGESTLIDAMAAAEEFRRLTPDHFDTLTQCSATFVKQRQGADMMYRRPHIVVDDNEDVVTVNWSPPFEGPLSVSPRLVEPYYRAYKAFERMLDNSLPEDCDDDDDDDQQQVEQAATLREYAEKYTWERRLEEGEILVFNNARMLHGRRGFSFSGDEGGRHLVGCYTNIDDTLNRYRVLQRDRPGGIALRNAGNGTCGMP